MRYRITYLWPQLNLNHHLHTALPVGSKEMNVTKILGNLNMFRLASQICLLQFFHLKFPLQGRQSCVINVYA